LIRLTNNKKYLCELKKLRDDIMNNKVVETKKSKLLKESENDIRKEIDNGIHEFYNEE
jgi:hypothetical protein